MPALIFDIETIGEDFGALDETTKALLTRRIKKEAAGGAEYEAALGDLKDGLCLSPLTGQIAAIGVLDSDQEQGAVYFQAPGSEAEEFEEDGFKFKAMGEKEMLEKFWELAQRYQEFVSFNGRGFDVPYMMIRSAAQRVKPSKDLMSNRYLGSQRYDAKHVDLLDQLNFYGAVWKKENLHLYCRAFGIVSPKAGGVCGDDVGKLFKEKKFVDIAKYNRGDLIATSALYRLWREYINFTGR